MATPLSAIQDELDRVAQRAAQAQRAFQALGGAAAGLKLGDITAAMKAAEAEQKRVAKEIEASEKRLAEERKKQIQAVFGAATAGANALRGPLNVFQTALSAVQTNILGFVAKANPAAVLRFNLALDDMLATVGQALVPVLNKVTEVMKVVGGAFLGLDEKGKTLVAGLGAAAVGLVAFGAAMLIVQTIATGGLLPIFAAVAGAFGGFAFVAAPIKGLMDRIGTAFVWVGNLFGGLVDSVMTGLAPAFSLFGSILDEFAPLVTTAFAVVGNLLSFLADAWAQGMVFILQTVTPYLLGFARAMMDVGRAVYDTMRTLLSFVGIALPEFGAKPPGEVKDPTGQAVRSTSTSDVSAVLQRAREAAFAAGLGAKDDPAKRTANGMDQLNRKAEEIRAEILKLVTDLPGKIGRALATELNNFLDNRSNTIGGEVRSNANAVAASPAAQMAASGVIPGAGLILALSQNGAALSERIFGK